MTGLFLRYCAACNSATPSVAKGSKCDGSVRIVDAFALIPALGRKMNKGHREAAVADLPGHDLPAA